MAWLCKYFFIGTVLWPTVMGFSSQQEMKNATLFQSSSGQPGPSTHTSAGLKEGRRSLVDRIASAHLASMGNTVADTVGQGVRHQLVWLGLLAMPLLFPVSLPGMASVVGLLCLLIGLGLCSGRSVQLPNWLGKRVLNARIKAMLVSMVHRAVAILARLGRPRMLLLSNKSARMLNGLMLGVTGLAMAVPVPVITFDNVLPALAIVLISWGLRLRDGLMLLAGYAVTAAAVVSVMLLWWGGSMVATNLLAWATI
jgi:hypothetical protein